MTSSLVGDDLIPIAVVVDDTMIRVEFNGGLQIATPVGRFPRLANASPEQRSQWRLIGRGDGIHWPEADEDISVRTLLSQPRRKPLNRIEQIPSLIGDLLKTTQQLNRLFEGRPFTPDGHLVESIGEVVAEYVYDLTLVSASTPQVDAYTRDGRSVQIKLTGERGTSYGFRWPAPTGVSHAELLIALKLTAFGFQEVYAGPFPIQLLEARPKTSNGQLSVSVAKLTGLKTRALAYRNSFEDLNCWFLSGLRDIA